jgi:hypothetical protein
MRWDDFKRTSADIFLVVMYNGHIFLSPMAEDNIRL